MEVIKAIKVLKDYCKNTSIEDCNNRKCEVWRVIGDCVFSETPEEWELKFINDASCINYNFNNETCTKGSKQCFMCEEYTIKNTVKI